MAKRNRESSGSAINESMAMDTRKFLSAVNNSAQAQIAFFEDAIRRLGEQNDKKWTLTALQSNRLIFEDVDTSEFMVADHKREKGGRVSITNIKTIILHEGRKPELFEQSCAALVDAIEEGNAKKIDAAYNRIAASRFRSTAVPGNGIVRTKDGVVRQVSVAKEDSSGLSLADRIIEALSDKITISESGVSGSFIDKDFGNWDLGVTELTTRKLVARNMRIVAESAYQSANFQMLVEAIAGLVCKDNLEQAIEYAAKFLSENQEFCMLDADGWERLTGDALAVRACFNEDLVRDTATLLRKTNLKVNREDLIEAWRKTAEKAQHPIMLENVDKLSSAVNFENAYDEFLSTILEATGETTRGALIAGLEMLKQKVGAGEVDDPTAEELDEVISNLKSKGDSASVWKAMETLDGVRRHVDKMQGLDDFDSMPGPMADDEVPPEEAGEELGAAAMGADAAVSGGGDKPLEISVKMDPAAMAMSAQAAAPAPEAEIAPEEGEEEGEDEFDLGSLEDVDLESPGEGGEEEDLLAASKDKDGKPISESVVTDFLKSELGEEEAEKGGVVQPDAEPQESVEEQVEPEEVDDLYALPKDIHLEESSINNDYKTVTEEDFSDSDVADFDKRFEGDDDPDAMQAAAEAYVREHKKDNVDSIRDPGQQQETVTDMAGRLIAKRLESRKMRESVDADEKLEEDQRKSPLRQLARRGFKKAAVNKLVKEGKLQWLRREDKAVLGEFNGIKFVIDHSEKPVAILSEDGEVQVPIPNDMVAGALYISEASENEAEADAFVEWLNQNIESLRREAGGSIDEEAAKLDAEDNSKSPTMKTVDEDAAELSGEEAELQESDEDGDDDINEGGLPAHLEKHKFKKKGASEEPESEEPESEEPESDESDEE